MPEPLRLVSREEWLRERTALLAQEKELTRARDAMLRRRRALPAVRVETPYRFQGPRGEVGLLDLFDGCRQLVVHHFMWIDARDEGCPSCTMQVDTLGELPLHLRAADTALAFVSRAPIAKLEAYRARFGWRTPLYSSAGTDFHYDFETTVDRARGATRYNYRDLAALPAWGGFAGDLPGQSVFLRDGDAVYHTYSAYARGTEGLSGAFAFLDLTPLGRQDGPGEPGWVRHRDRYDAPVPLARAGAARG